MEEKFIKGGRMEEKFEKGGKIGREFIKGGFRRVRMYFLKDLAHRGAEAG